MSHYSASQIKLFRRCPAAYAFAYRDQLPRSTSPKAEYGKALHKIAEHYAHTGEIPNSPLGQVFAQGRGYLPTPSPSLLVEEYFSIPLGDDELIGYIDLLDPESGLVVDHKSTGSLRYAHTAESLAQDPQAIIYALESMRRTGRTEAPVRFVYYVASVAKIRRPAGSAAVEVLFDLDAIAPEVERIEQDIDAMRAIRAGGDGEKNPRECGAFGGCDFAGICERSMHERIGGWFA